MFNMAEFNAALARKGCTRKELAEMLDINEVTLYRKLKRGGDFTREEINIMIDRLDICDPVEIFFAEVLE